MAWRAGAFGRNGMEWNGEKEGAKVRVDRGFEASRAVRVESFRFGSGSGNGGSMP